MTVNSYVQLPCCALRTIFPCDHPQSLALTFLTFPETNNFRAFSTRLAGSIVWVWDEHHVNTLWSESEKAPQVHVLDGCSLARHYFDGQWNPKEVGSGLDSLGIGL